jgi:RNA polymerase sigma factor (sigma-70 family)
MDPVLRYFRKMRSILHRRGRKREEIEDLMQDAYVRLLEYCRSGAEVREPEALLVRTVQRLSMNFDRDEHRDLYAVSPVEALQHLIDPEPNPLEVLEAQQCLDKATRALDAVSRRTRDVFFMHRLGGLTYAQIAQQTGMPVSTVEKHIARAMTILLEERRRELGSP